MFHLCGLLSPVPLPCCIINFFSYNSIWSSINRDVGYEKNVNNYLEDGLNSVHYAKKEDVLLPLFTHISVSIGKVHDIVSPSHSCWFLIQKRSTCQIVYAINPCNPTPLETTSTVFKKATSSRKQSSAVGLGNHYIAAIQSIIVFVMQIQIIS
jgi:hypothetical protein